MQPTIISAQRPPSRGVHPRLGYLQNAAQALHSTAPSTSAFLGSELHRLADETGLNLDIAAKSSPFFDAKVLNCGACGALLSSDVAKAKVKANVQDLPHKSRSKRKRNSREANSQSLQHSRNGQITFFCQRCTRKTCLMPSNSKTSVEPRSGVTAGPKVDVKPVSPQRSELVSAQHGAQRQPIVRSSGKMRAKRRKQGGLSSSLYPAESDVNQGQVQSEALGLMDFLKPD